MAKQWTEDRVLQIVRAFQPACVLSAAADLDIFTLLKNEPMTAQSLSAKLSSNLRATTVLLDALTALGFLIKRKNKYIAPPQIADLLSETGCHNILPAVRHLANCHRRWLQLAQAVKTGKPAEAPPSIRGEAADRDSFIGAMNIFSTPIIPHVINCLQPLSFKHMLDIGGASGTWTIEFLKSVPQANATLFDLPDVIPLAQKRITEASLSKRVSLVAGDFYKDDLPASVDFVWLSAVTHQNSRQQNRELFSKIYSALQENGILVIRDVVMDESRTNPQTGALFAVNMLVATESGGTYTFDEFREDLSHAGFVDATLLYRGEYMNSLIRAKKPPKSSFSD